MSFRVSDRVTPVIDSVPAPFTGPVRHTIAMRGMLPPEIIQKSFFIRI
jgi:hypothetical protein